MAILESINESTVVPDNSLIQDVAEELGVSLIAERETVELVLQSFLRECKT